MLQCVLVSWSQFVSSESVGSFPNIINEMCSSYCLQARIYCVDVLYVHVEMILFCAFNAVNRNSNGCISISWHPLTSEYFVVDVFSFKPSLTPCWNQWGNPYFLPFSLSYRHILTDKGKKTSAWTHLYLQKNTVCKLNQTMWVCVHEFLYCHWFSSTSALQNMSTEDNDCEIKFARRFSHLFVTLVWIGGFDLKMMNGM